MAEPTEPTLADQLRTIGARPQAFRPEYVTAICEQAATELDYLRSVAGSVKKPADLVGAVRNGGSE